MLGLAMPLTDERCRSNRGGWTVREMLGSGYEKFSGINAQKDFQESLERVSGRIHSPQQHQRKGNNSE